MPRRFRFRLERLRRVREIEERVARAAWAGAEAEVATAEAREAQRREALEGARSSLERQLSPEDGRALDPGRILWTDRAITLHVAALARARELRLTLRDQADREAELWRARERDRRALFELERREHHQHRLEGERRDDAQRDEEALARRLRRNPATARRGPEKDSSQPPFPSDEG